ncbi:MAG: Phytanoyl-CoA hydroxylase [Planctomycetaceae bacterium]|nr:Phytanoyl-CoA hydroxylase [Planctomycetaceae bacterium]
MNNIQYLKDCYSRDGFVVVRQLLAPTDYSELRQQVDRYIREVVPGLPAGDAFYDADRSRPETLKQLQRMEQDLFFSEYLLNPVWKGLAEALLDEEANASGAEWFNKPPGTNHITPPHQDNYYFSLKPPQVLTMWMALDPVDEENGCLRYVPGSHVRGIRPHGRTKTLGFSQGILDYGDMDYAIEVPVPLQPGDITVHHGNTIHRADANTSPSRHRRSFAMVYKGVSCQRDETAFARYLAASKAHEEQLMQVR